MIKPLKIRYVVSLCFLVSCSSVKLGESWNMQPKDKTIGLTLLWQLPEEKLKQMLPEGQLPKIQNGKGVLMLFLASTEAYKIGQKQYGQLGIAHLIIPLNGSISIVETIGLKNQRIISDLKQISFKVRYGDVQLNLEEVGEKTKIDGTIKFEKGFVKLSGITENKKGQLVSIEKTTLVGKEINKNFLRGPEFYFPINFEAISINQTGENWIHQFNLNTPPDSIWVNVDFGIDFKYYNRKLQVF